MNLIKVGYYKEYLDKFCIELPIDIDFIKNPHWVIAGASGTGKTYALEGYIRQLQKYDVQLYIADFKQELFESEQRDVYEVISDFYRIYRNKERVKILIIDEYITYIKHMQLINKKKAKDIMSMMSEIIMLGRSYQSCLWVVVQRPDAKFMIDGMRDNFFVKILFGDSSRESKIMLFGESSSDVLDSRDMRLGEGLIYWDNKIAKMKVKN